MLKKLILIVACFICSLSFSNEKEVIDAFKDLAGKWSIHSGAKKLSIQMSYDIGSRESIVMEKFGKELSVFSQSGKDLIITHFCNSGHQSRLKLKKRKLPNVYHFKMFDVLNKANKKSPFINKIIYKIKSSKEVSLEIVWKKGRKETSEKYKLLKI